MKININENHQFQLEEVYNSIRLISTLGEIFDINMRDGGFEFEYGNIRYEAKNGNINTLCDVEFPNKFGITKKLFENLFNDICENESNGEKAVNVIITDTIVSFSIDGDERGIHGGNFITIDEEGNIKYKFCKFIESCCSGVIPILINNLKLIQKFNDNQNI